jgi:adenylate kinase family enzyme
LWSSERRALGKPRWHVELQLDFQLPHIELDAINWLSEWRDLTRHDPEEFVRRVTEAIQAEAWVVDGNYGPVRERVWARATHLIWLDYERAVIMARVISRSFFRAFLRTELWAGNRERWRHMLHPSHPIRWTWSTWERRRRETAEGLLQPDYAHLVVLRLHHPREVSRALNFLGQASVPTALSDVEAKYSLRFKGISKN